MRTLGGAVAVVAPAPFHRPLAQALEAAGLEALCLPRPAPGVGRDPFGLEALARRVAGRADALLLVAPPWRSPRALVPGPVVGGLPVGLVFAQGPQRLTAWLAALEARGSPGPGERAVLAAWDEHYLRLGRRFTRHLRAAGDQRTVTWFANRLNRPALLERLARGPALAAYFGHGHADGLGGYHGVYLEHFEACPPRRPCGLFAAWACDTLKREHGRVSLGRFLVESGRAAAFLGATEPVLTQANAALVGLAGEVFERARPGCLGRWVRDIDAALAPQSAEQLAWQRYRLVGNPLQPL